jgi:hypothetical protein
MPDEGSQAPAPQRKEGTLLRALSHASPLTASACYSTVTVFARFLG